MGDAVMFGTFKADDVTLLLKDITGLVRPQPASERELLIQGGTHYSEMLPLEYVPTSDYLRIYEIALNRFADKTAASVAVVSKKIAEVKGDGVVLVSLARAGIPAGILIKHYLQRFYSIDASHYAVSIIRGRGIDRNAMAYILARHAPKTIQFIDGWTGKGTIKRELDCALANYSGVGSELAVLSDPANVASICGTREDFLIASSCLNSTVSGLLSRTFLRDDVIGPHDFHGAAFYRELLDSDRTYEFIDTVESRFNAPAVDHECNNISTRSGIDEVKTVADMFGIGDINLVKPGVGETTRVLLRRIPWKVLVSDLNDDANLGHLFQLAREKEIEVLEYPLINYRACGLIREMADS